MHTLIYRKEEEKEYETNEIINQLVSVIVNPKFIKEDKKQTPAYPLYLVNSIPIITW